MERPLVEQQEVWKGSEELVKIFDMQIRRDMDYVRAKAYWSRSLQDLPLAALTEALARLSSGRYQMVPNCRCHRCNHRH
ncbi:hypothetical protein BLL42_23570 [Pseudomonas frederiksbergensis]|uniref:Uncharacterized protein n=1 Tax=Pseudomonas frederiksbergensis TaxID=104087 RepID=A0A1J0ER18_9PSED|nr:hypothetical protein [Pseudomonas frederiksbergensis]APC18545.1 hypothetical protein BLL42_23570 [Pseudomonas frederiksbergensis]